MGGGGGVYLDPRISLKSRGGARHGGPWLESDHGEARLTNSRLLPNAMMIGWNRSPRGSRVLVRLKPKSCLARNTGWRRWRQCMWQSLLTPETGDKSRPQAAY